MDIENSGDGGELAARLKRLDASATLAAPSFGYQSMLDRHVAKQGRARRRLALARGTASALAVALVGVSVWRLDHGDARPIADEFVPVPASAERANQPRIVRADTYLAVAALEDHLATLDDALSDARVSAAPAEVARLERTRAEVLDSYTRVRYAEMLSANF